LNHFDSSIDGAILFDELDGGTCVIRAGIRFPFILPC
jgi:hypothetical protein